MYYNPFEVSKYTDEQIVELIKNSLDKCINDAEESNVLAENVMNLSDVLYLYGELCTRAKEEYSLIKYNNDLKEIELTAKKKEESTTKGLTAPYFKALAQKEMADDFKKEIAAKANVDRLTSAYDATKEKINAVKKKIDSKRYEF